ncbi:MAG: hypothetical protein ACFFDF_21805 [Candidatus Odinarchaeota archaeon]
MIYNNPENPISEYERTINKLTDQITELFSKIHFYQALIAEKDHKINQLINENQQLKTQINSVSLDLRPPSPPSQDSYTPPPIRKPPVTPTTPLTEQSLSTSADSQDPRINKRVCPNCGATGFAIREIDDKSNIISYIPRRIYAKKRSCTKCRYEW